MSIQPKNWTQFQHYKDRKPPWIKLHHGLLDDFTFARLPLASRALAPLLWLLASEYSDGKITAPIEEIAFRLHVTADELADALKPLVIAGLFIDDSNTLASCKQVALLETEAETQEQTEAESPSLRSVSDVSRAISDYWPPDFRERFWEAYPRKVGRKSAYAKLQTIRARREVTFEKLMAGVAKIRGPEPRFIPHPSTWLNRGGWDDEPAPTFGGSNGFGGPRSLQDDSRSVSKAIDRRLEQASELSFPPRPSLMPQEREADRRLLPAGRSTEP